jgi:Protein of unknown function (DUF1097)
MKNKEFPMSPRIADTVSIGLLAGLSCLLTAYVIDVPIWVVFIAWASFFAAGGGVGAALTTLAMAGLGIVSAVLTLLAAAALGGSPPAVAGCVVVGAGALVVIRNAGLLRFTPAGFFGFAAVVGTIAATGTSVDAALTVSHPAALVTVAVILGVGFGVASEHLGTALAGRRRTAAVE